MPTDRKAQEEALLKQNAGNLLDYINKIYRDGGETKGQKPNLNRAQALVVTLLDKAVAATMETGALVAPVVRDLAADCVGPLEVGGKSKAAQYMFNIVSRMDEEGMVADGPAITRPRGDATVASRIGPQKGKPDPAAEGIKKVAGELSAEFDGIVARNFNGSERHRPRLSVAESVHFSDFEGDLMRSAQTGTLLPDRAVSAMVKFMDVISVTRGQEFADEMARLVDRIIESPLVQPNAAPEKTKLVDRT